MRARTHRGRRWSVITAAAALAAGVLAGCTGSEDDGGSSGTALDQAQQALEETSGVDLTVTTKSVPEGSDGVLLMEGTATSAPAFDGDVRFQVNDLTDKVPMIAVDGAVYAQLPYTDVFSEIDPADYGTPDPAELMDPGHGIPGWLAKTQNPQESDGEVTGRIPGNVVAELFESADRNGKFDVTYQLDDDRLQRAVVSGPFYGNKTTTYTVDIGQYDVTKDITRP